ncbi:hypothetical protein KW882_02000 [Vibrio parahaemolyticus]
MEYPQKSAAVDARHNLSTESLLMALKLGFIPAPSHYATISDANELFGSTAKFGAHTLVAGEDLTKATIKELHDCDVYTPRSPTYLFKSNEEKITEIADDLNGLIVEEILRGAVEPIKASEIKANLDQGGVRGLLTHGMSTGLMLAYCKSKGVEVEIPISDEIDSRYSMIYKHTEVAALLNEFREDGGYKDNSDRKKVIKEEVERCAQEWRDNFNTDETPFDRYVGGFRENATLFRVVDGIERHLSMGSNKVDTIKLSGDLSAVVFKNDDFKVWVDKQFSGTIDATYIKKIMPHGEVDIIEATPENILEQYVAFKEEGEGFHYGSGSIRSIFAKNYQNEFELRLDKNRFVSESEMKSVCEKIDDTLDEIIEHLIDNYADDISTDTATEGLHECLKKYNDLGTDCFAGSWFSGAESDDWLCEAVDEFVEMLKNAPSEYAEAKIYENVSLSDYKGILVRESVAEGLKEELEGHGLVVISYTNEEERIEKMKTLSSDIDKMKFAAPKVASSPSFRA